MKFITICIVFTRLIFAMLLSVNIFWSIVSGTSDGQTKVVREGDNGVAYSWNLREQKWDKVIYILVLRNYHICVLFLIFLLNICL